LRPGCPSQSSGISILVSAGCPSKTMPKKSQVSRSCQFADGYTETTEGTCASPSGALEADGLGFSDAIERVVVDRGELTFHVRRERLVAVCEKLLKEPALRFEIFSGVSGVHYPDDTGRELRAVYHLVSITHNRRLRLEVSAPDGDAHIPSVVPVYPSANWHERETWDFFGIVFDGHPGLTRIEMPDDWRGHPQRKDYPLGGIPVEYRGTKVPPPEERRWYA
jgi:NADH-quinone oxidoreductase subunit C